jgi:cytoskeletal protein RodZ
MFEIRVARAYARAVMNRFEEAMKYAAAYKISQDPEGGPNDWVVQHTNRSYRIVWGQHQFKVVANVEHTC